MIETVSVSERVVSRSISKEIHVPKGKSWPRSGSRVRSPSTLLLPLTTRDKDSLIDNLSLLGRTDTTVLPRETCQFIARYVLRLAWRRVSTKSAQLGVIASQVLDDLMRIPESSVLEAERRFLRVVRLVSKAAGPQVVHQATMKRLLGWADFFVYSHVLWVIAKPTARGPGQIKLEYQFDAPYAPRRGLKQARQMNAIRLAISGPFDAQSYHFRMAAPNARYFYSQSIRTEVDGERQTLLTGQLERPYAHLYAQYIEPKVGQRIWASLRISESPPWSSSRVAVIAALSALIAMGLLLKVIIQPGATVSASAAALLLALPAAAAFWVGAPTGHEIINTLPLLSRSLLISSGVVSIFSAVLVSTFSDISPLQSGAIRLTIREPNVYLTGLSMAVILQFAIAVVSSMRTLNLMRRSRILRHGPKSVI